MYIVLETHGGAVYTVACINEDGSTKVFDDLKSALHYANNECLDGMPVRIE